MDHAARAGDPAGAAGRRKLTLSSRVGANSPSPGVAASAGPSVSSSMAARNPPCTLPIGLAKPARASKKTSISPLSGATQDSSQPSVAAAGGARLPPGQKLPERPGPADHRRIAYAGSLAHATDNPWRYTTGQQTLQA